MIYLKLSEILRDVEFHSRKNADPETVITSVTSDSGKVTPGGVFVCLRGLHHDGHGFINEAISKGASLIVAETGVIPECELPAGSILTEDTHSALAVMVHNFCGRPSESLKITAITGTNGKTTVAGMLGAIYSRAGEKTAEIGTLTGSMTTPDPEVLYPRLREIADAGIRRVFMEASSHALALGKLTPLRPETGIFTNLTPEHLDFHHDMENYYAAKTKLFSMCGTGIISVDDEYGARLASEAPCPVLTFSRTGLPADFTASAITSSENYGTEYELKSRGKMLHIKVPSAGLFTVSNSLAAAACALTDNIRPGIIRDALLDFRGVPGRLERIPLPGCDFSVYIDFAHTPDALENILRTVRSFLKDGSRLTVLFGCGGDRDPSKRQVMGAVASRLADHVIVTSDNSRSEEPKEIIRQILKGIDKERPYSVIEDRREAIRYAIRYARKGDVILLAGKGHETYEITRDGKKPFCEADIVREAAKDR